MLAIVISMKAIVISMKAIVIEMKAIGIEMTITVIEMKAIGIEMKAIGIERPFTVIEMMAIAIEMPAPQSFGMVAGERRSFAKRLLDTDEVERAAPAMAHLHEVVRPADRVEGRQHQRDV